MKACAARYCADPPQDKPVELSITLGADPTSVELAVGIPLCKPHEALLTGHNTDGLSVQ